MKLMLTISTDDPSSAPSQQDILAVAEQSRDRGCVVNMVDGVGDSAMSSPEGLTEPFTIVELWLDDRMDVEAAAAAWSSLGTVGGYTIEEVVQRPIPRTGKPGPTAGVTNIFPVGRQTGISVEEFADHWKKNHGPLALRVHYGMTGYVQNIVRSRFLDADERVDGFSNLQFPSVDDSINKLYINEEGAADVAADVAKFVGWAIPYRCFEHVVHPVL